MRVSGEAAAFGGEWAAGVNELAPDVSVVIVTYRSVEHIEHCVKALQAAAQGPGGTVSVETVVVDNASPDSTVALVERLALADVLVTLDSNVGFAAGVNAGLARATGEFVCLVNPDAIAHPGSLAIAVAYARKNPNRGLYGALTYNADGTGAHPGGWALPNLRSAACFAVGLSSAFPKSARFNPESLGRWRVGDEREVGALSGFFLLARRSLLRELAGFDESFFMYSEDIDLAVRAKKLGARPVIVPGAAVTHIGGASSSSVDKTVMVLRGRIAFMRKHWSWQAAAVGKGMLISGVGMRALGANVSGRGTKWRGAWSKRAHWKEGWQAPSR